MSTIDFDKRDGSPCKCMEAIFLGFAHARIGVAVRSACMFRRREGITCNERTEAWKCRFEAIGADRDYHVVCCESDPRCSLRTSSQLTTAYAVTGVICRRRREQSESSIGKS